MDWILDLLTQLGTTSNYSATADLHILQFITAPVKPSPACCVLTSRSLATASNSGDSSASRPYVLFHSRRCRTLVNSLNCQLSRCQLFPIILSAGPGSSLYSLGADTTENTVSNNSYILVIAGYLATVRIFTRLFVSAGTCLPSSYLATAAFHNVTAKQRVYTPQYLDYAMAAFIPNMFQSISHQSSYPSRC
jgi:hypothetical protein